MVKISAKKLKEGLVKKKPRKVITPDMLLSSGSTILNLACSGDYRGAFVKGHYYLIVGDSAAGKTVLVLTTLAEAANDPNFKDHRLIYYPTERGALFNMREFFGRKMARRLEIPKQLPETVEDMYYEIDDNIEDGRPFIAIVDSIDSLTTKDEEKHFRKLKKAKREGDEAKGSYGVSKAKLNSTSLRRLMTPLKSNGSILFLVAQTRDSFGMFAPKTRAGGHALTFYATLELWLSRFKTLKTTYKGEKVPIGGLSKIRVKKNRVQGKDRSILVPIYDQFKYGGGGVDDVGSMIDYLTKWKHWSATRGIIDATEFDFKGHKEKLIKAIDVDGSYEELQKITNKVWLGIEKECAVERRRKYE